MSDRKGTRVGAQGGVESGGVEARRRDGAAGVDTVVENRPQGRGVVHATGEAEAETADGDGGGGRGR